MIRTLIVVPALLLSSLALANPTAEAETPAATESTETTKPEATVPTTFADIDADASKTISLVEAEKVEALKKAFKVVDLDESGDLSDVEYKTWKDAEAEKLATNKE